MTFQEETSYEKLRKFINLNPKAVSEAIYGVRFYNIKPELEGFNGYVPVYIEVDIKDLSKFAKIWDNLC